jgi:NADP-dependent 3-hydroxy acid dehydrogenase YdfG
VLAERLIQNGSFVIAVGRRKENLDSFVQKHGPEKAAATQFDIYNQWSRSICGRVRRLDMKIWYNNSMEIVR